MSVLLHGKLYTYNCYMTNYTHTIVTWQTIHIQLLHGKLYTYNWYMANYTHTIVTWQTIENV